MEKIPKQLKKSDTNRGKEQIIMNKKYKYNLYLLN